MYAYILVATDDSRVEELVEDFKESSEVEEVNILFGEWDLIIKLKVNEAEDITRFVLEKIRNKDEVRFTSTLIVAK